MRIALLHYSAPPVVGGVESVIAHQARLMANAGHTIAVITGRGDSFDPRINVRVIPLMDSRHTAILEIKKQLDIGKIPADFETTRATLQKELTECLAQQDIVIIHNIASLHKNLPLTAALHRLNPYPGILRLILWHHDLAWTTPRYAGELYNDYPWNLLSMPWQGVTHVTISTARQQELCMLMGIPPAAVHIVPNGIDIARFYKLDMETLSLLEKMSLHRADPLLLLPVRITPRKNIELALHVLAELKLQFHQAMLVVTGPEGPHNPANATYKQYLLTLRAKLDLRGNAHFLAEMSPRLLPDSVIADLYRLADALILPSREEGFGIPIIEAGFDRLPVFCSDIPALRELGGNDLNYFNLDSAPSAIARLISDHLQLEAATRWKRRVQKDFSWEHIYLSKIAPLLKEII